MGKEKLTVQMLLAFFMHIVNNSVNKGPLGGLNAARAALRHKWLLVHPQEPSPTDNLLVNMFLKAIRRRWNVITKKKEALTSDQFVNILLYLKGDKNWDEVTFINHRFAAQMVVMFGCLARFEESQALTIRQVEFSLAWAVVNFKKSKKFEVGEMASAVLATQPELKCNPFTVLKSYVNRISLLKDPDFFLFPAMRGSSFNSIPVTYDTVRKQFKDALIKAEIVKNPDDFGLHSCRRGAVSNAVNKGGDPFMIAKAMRVRTVGIVHHYAKVDNNNLANICNLVFS